MDCMNDGVWISPKGLNFCCLCCRFNVYVSQTEVKPGCVLRQSNWQVLESRGLVNSAEVQACKRNMNTFGFVGDLRQAPEISCVYHSETAENQFLKDPSKATLGDGFQPKTFEE